MYPTTCGTVSGTQIGDHQPRAFVANDEVMVSDLRPNATDKGTVTRVLGPLNYEVLVDGHIYLPSSSPLALLGQG